MTDHAFNRAQAAYDAAEPDDDELAPADPAILILEDLLATLDCANGVDDSGDVHVLSDQQATAAIWIDGHEFSLTLQRED